MFSYLRLLLLIPSILFIGCGAEVDPELFQEEEEGTIPLASEQNKPTGTVSGQSPTTITTTQQSAINFNELIEQESLVLDLEASLAESSDYSLATHVGGSALMDVNDGGIIFNGEGSYLEYELSDMPELHDKLAIKMKLERSESDRDGYILFHHAYSVRIVQDDMKIALKFAEDKVSIVTIPDLQHSVENEISFLFDQGRILIQLDGVTKYDMTVDDTTSEFASLDSDSTERIIVGADEEYEGNFSGRINSLSVFHSSSAITEESAPEESEDLDED